MADQEREFETPMVQQVVFSQEMFYAMMQTLNSNNAPSAGRNFAHCNDRFDGSNRSDISTFIDSITIYKECVNIPNDMALKGLPMLLEGQAAVWWQGVKSSITTFDEAVKALKNAYGHEKAPHQIYKELFSVEQKSGEKTDIYISRCRALFAKLPPSRKPPLVCQLDMVFGLLNFRIRSRLDMSEISDFDDLINYSRIIEQSLDEENQLTNKPNYKPLTDNNRSIIQCRYCKKFGHSKSNCEKLKHKEEEPIKASTSTPVQSESNRSTFTRPAGSGIICYGCGKQGYVRSNCPNCKHSPSRQVNSTSASIFQTESSQDAIFMPLIQVLINNTHDEIACVDTGAKRTLAGIGLMNYLIKSEQPYRAKQIIYMMADGIERNVNAKEYYLDIQICDKIIPMFVLVIPEHRGRQTLLGRDFLDLANIVLNIPEGFWYFTHSPQYQYLFEEEEFNDNRTEELLMEINDDAVVLREDEGILLEEDQKQELKSLFKEYVDNFEPSIQPTLFVEHAIKLTENISISHPPYRMSEPNKKLLQDELDQLLENGTIEACESQYLSPIVMVPKPNGKIRLCVNYKALNEITVTDKYPIPRIDDVLHEAKRTPFMSTLDLKAGYHQVAVRECDRDKTAFICPLGVFRYKRMPFGLKNAPSTFQRLIDRFKAGIPDVTIFAYLDDMIILSGTFDEHLKDLRAVFERLRTYRLKLNREKCVFITSSIKYLGHLITPNGIQPDPMKISVIKERKPPRNVKELLSFIQTCSWFRRFIPNFAEISKPLTNLTRKNVKWQWETVQVDAFEKLKILLTTSPILQQADSTKPYKLRTDASSYALGAVLLQGEDHDEKPIEYASRLSRDAEINYHTTEREALAVVWAVEKFRGYLESAEFTVQTDHQPLKWLFTLKSPTGRLARWALILQSYNLKIDYTPGKLNVVADTLSRPPIEKEIVSTNFVTIDLPKENQKTLREKQLSDPDVKKIIDCLENSKSDILEQKKWIERGYIISEGLLYKIDYNEEDDVFPLVLPKFMIPEILHEYHDSETAGHYGIDKTIRKIRSRYFWPGLIKTVTDHISKCLMCQRYKVKQRKPSGLIQTPAMARRFEVISFDLFGPLPQTESGKRWILIIEDNASRWVEIFPLKDATAQICAEVLINEIILRYGTPRRVISDNGVQFVSEIMQHVAYCMGFHQHLIPLYHAEANPVERKNRDMKTQLAILVGNKHSEWEKKLPAIRFTMNTSRCDSTGFTPAFLTFGRELRTPDDVHHDMKVITENDNFVPEVTPYLLKLVETLREAKEEHEKTQDKNKRYADKLRSSDAGYKEGDLVLVDTHILSRAKDGITSKFVPKRDGPYEIVKVVTPTTYEVNISTTDEPVTNKYHSTSLTPYRNNDEEVNPIYPLRRRGRPRKVEEIDNTIMESKENNEEEPDGCTRTRSGRIVRPPNRNFT